MHSQWSLECVMTSKSSRSSINNDRHPRNIKGLTETQYRDPNTWPTFDEGALDEKKLTVFLSRKKAVIMYLSGYSDYEIQNDCGIGSKQVNRLIRERCVLTHPDGLIYGWRGLVPQLHIKPYVRTKNIDVDRFGYGAAGAMQTILVLNPDLKEKLDQRILRPPKSNQLEQINTSKRSIWRWFLDYLRKLGYDKRGEWPFGTVSQGYYSISRYIDQILCNNPKKAARLIGRDVEKKLISGDGVNRPVDRVFQRVEMDAHKIDGRFCIMMPTLDGDYHPKMVYRIWVIVIIEILSRAVLGYFMSMAKEVSKEDVLRTIKNALSPWNRKNLTFNENAYMEDAGLPSGISSDFVGICWDETNVDGALAETCKHVETVLKNVVGSKLMTPSTGYSSRRSKDDRPFVEAYFRNLASKGFQRLSNTTGSKPSDKKGREPDAVALTSQFQLEYAEELLDVLIANYNATPHSGLGHRTPLEYLQFICSSRDTSLRRADDKSIQEILAFRKSCRVNGSLEEGRKPFVNFSGARYTNETLQQRFDLINKHIWVINHLEDDARVVQASTLDGKKLGILRASPPWHKLPHSLKVRNAINAALRSRKFALASKTDAVEAFIDYVESHSKLPVHPAYLELRRILTQQANQDIGKTTLELALRSESKKPLKKLNNIQKEVISDCTDSQPLPPRRIAASD